LTWLNKSTAAAFVKSFLASHSISLTNVFGFFHLFNMRCAHEIAWSLPSEKSKLVSALRA
jgi:hypothetical protein